MVSLVQYTALSGTERHAERIFTEDSGRGEEGALPWRCQGRRPWTPNRRW